MLNYVRYYFQSFKGKKYSNIFCRIRNVRLSDRSDDFRHQWPLTEITVHFMNFFCNHSNITTLFPTYLLPSSQIKYKIDNFRGFFFAQTNGITFIWIPLCQFKRRKKYENDVWCMQNITVASWVMFFFYAPIEPFYATRQQVNQRFIQLGYNALMMICG